jgi:hypothetical protein
MIWAITEESIATVEVTATDTPAGSQGESLHADDPSILTRTDEQVTRSVRDPAHSFDAVHYKIQSYSLQLDRITQYAGEIGSRLSLLKDIAGSQRAARATGKVCWHLGQVIFCTSPVAAI